MREGSGSTGNDHRSVAMQNMVILLLTIALTAVFVGMIWQFLTALFLAVVFSALANPLYRRILARSEGSQAYAAFATILILILIVLVPALFLINLIANQAIELSENIVPWVQQQFHESRQNGFRLPEWLPFRERLEGYGPQIAEKLGQIAAKAGGFLVKGLSAATRGTASFFLSLFVMLYAMFYFLRQGAEITRKIGAYIPLSGDIQRQLARRGMSMTRATIKGSIVIGLIQGLLGGVAFAVVGIQGPAFWGAVMAVASLIPGFGTALVWVPAVIYLLATGEIAMGVGLLLWSALVVGTVDNVLRPILVGSDTKIPDLLILLGTLGGLALFGAAGLIIGPVITALFVTIWEIYYVAFHDVLPNAKGKDLTDD